MDVKRQTKPVPTKCTICEDTALYSYFGVIACQPCKVFFRRNAERGPEILKCVYNGHCEINVKTRHICSYCRLMKCFQSGMKNEMIRPSRSKPNKRKEKETIESSTQIKSNAIEQFPTLNLLQSDQSTLTIDQWNLLSNLSNCFDEHSGISIGEQFMSAQYVLPPKTRFKNVLMIEFIQKLLNESQSLYKNNRDFISLLVDDRSLLLHNTFKHVGSLSANFIIYKVRLMDCPIYFDAIGSISHPRIIDCAKHVATRLDFDMIIMKLFLAILSFSTSSYTVYSNSPPVNLSNIKLVLHIQNTYIELLWQYLLYKYNFKQAVECLSELIRCFFAIHAAAVVTHDIQWLTETIHSLVQQTEQTFSLDD